MSVKASRETNTKLNFGYESYRARDRRALLFGADVRVVVLHLLRDVARQRATDLGSHPVQPVAGTTTVMCNTKNHDLIRLGQINDRVRIAPQDAAANRD